MLDIKFIRENKEEIKEAIKNKNIDLNLDTLLELDKKRTMVLQEIEKFKEEKNKLNDQIKKELLYKAIKNEKEFQSKLAAEIESISGDRGKKIKEEINKREIEFKKIKEQLDLLMVKVPVIPSPDTPVGKSDEENVEIHRWGDQPKFNFTPKNHIQLGKDLDILDLERGAKVGGYRGYFLKNEGTLLAMAIMQYALNKMVEKKYIPMIPPTLVGEFSLFGSGYFKGLEYNGETDEIYQVATSDKEACGKVSKDKKFLVGTAEPSLLAYYSNEILDEKILPIRLCGYSQCYRSEIGSYGKDTKGMYRVHEFMKIEQVILSKADVEESNDLQQEMISISKEMHEELGLPYRQLQICTGDMSPGKYKMFDIEAWMPGMGRYGETGSASNFLDWQARRLKVKYKTEEGEKKYVYMLNNTALPSPRIFIAILENGQQADGSVVIPEVLQKWMPGNLEVIKRK